MKTLYLHIGTPKTGTTSVQFFCKKNRELLYQRGIAYPLFATDGIINDTRNGHFLVEQHLLPDGGVDKKTELAIVKERMGELHKIFGEVDSILLSDEGLWHKLCGVKKKRLERLKKDADRNGYQIKIIVYLRRQDTFLSSWWNQSIKMNGRAHNQTWEDFLKEDYLHLDYYNELEAMAKVVGKENIIVRRFDKKSFEKRSLFEDFFEILGITLDEEFQYEEQSRNIGLMGNTHEIKRILNGMPELSLEWNDYLKGTLQSISKCSGQAYPNNMFSEEETKLFLEQYAQGNQKVSEEYMGDGKPLFDDTISKLPKWEKENPYLYDDLVRFTGAVCERLYKENRILEEKLDQALSDIAKLKETSVWYRMKRKANHLSKKYSNEDNFDGKE